MLTFRLELTQGLFCNGLRNFEPLSDNEDNTWTGSHSSNFLTTPAGRRLVTTYDLRYNMPHTRRIFGGKGFRAWNPLARCRNLTTRSARPRKL
ncbi:hypothetical protein AVEN_159459-1 [Araneus ventricosus]|uniref:Uncharacterized protein n=1 Tax=Araneus ventricosus TaxID=182803 RepID=A0A4Y2A242_ARAVE|nr:hypothetical protein AVEN_159459-1 [Araneus ventricosus]